MTCKKNITLLLCLLTLLAVFPQLNKTFADSGLPMQNTIRIGLHYGALSLPGVTVSNSGDVQFYVEDMLGQKRDIVSDNPSSWTVLREAIRLEVGPFTSLAVAEQAKSRWPHALEPAAIVKESTGYHVFGGTFLSAEQAWQSVPTLSALGFSNVRLRGALHLRTVDIYGQEEALALREVLTAAEVKNVRMVYDGSYRLAVGSETDIQGINNLRQALVNLTPNTVWEVQQPNFRRIDVLRHDGQWLLTYDNLPGMPLRIEPLDEFAYMSVQGKHHRGHYELFLDGDNRFTVVGIMDIEDYLKGVVAREMPALWHIEALKSQAVVARTYTQANRGKHAHHGFDLCTFSTCCQAYGGVEWEHPQSNTAVEATRGHLLFFNGRPALTFYHSDSGGHTESNHNVWNSAPIPYLAGVEDPYPALAGSSHTQWSSSFDQREMQAILANNSVNVGDILRLEVSERLKSGRVAVLTVYGTRGQAELVRQQPRIFNGALSLFALRSTMYDVTNTIGTTLHISNGANVHQQPTFDGLAVMTADGLKTLAPATDYVVMGAGGQVKVGAIPQSFVFDGSGWGHGVGLSQWGARGMAEQGYTYQDILLHYYQGVEIIEVKR